uniref:Calponin-homology (CH) domain-containing protein n=1 Tax=Mastacembelus armatus TaxID=205130 RepID=A0A3Q3LQL3_9TELE
MIMQEEAKWDPQKKSAIEFSDQQVQQLQDERKAVQKRTFTRWMNVFLQRCDPPVEVSDLYTDIQDGRILMALLEELSGCKLVRIELLSGFTGFCFILSIQSCIGQFEVELHISLKMSNNFFKCSFCNVLY